MNVVKDMPTTLCTQKLSEEIRQTKSASTAKGYLAAINKLEEFFGRDVISINDFTTTFIEDFQNFSSLRASQPPQPPSTSEICGHFLKSHWASMTKKCSDRFSKA